MWIGDMIKMAANANPKNELVYTPLTMAEWTVTGVGSTKGAGSIHLVADDNVDGALIQTNLKNATKYGLLYIVTDINLDNSFAVVANVAGDGIAYFMTAVVGNNKLSFVTANPIPSNALKLAATSGNTNGKYIDFKDIRLFELPAGSQIETDFANLTADQLNVKYPM